MASLNPLIDGLRFSMLMTDGGWILMMLGIGLFPFTSEEMVIATLAIVIIASLFLLRKLPSLNALNIFNLYVQRVTCVI